MAVEAIGKARRLSDTELVSADFRYNDPENGIEGLNLDVPDPDANPTIVGYYDLTPVGGRKAKPPIPFVRCCHCGKRRHWKGHVVRDDKGEIYIIGSRGCGREHYGVRYEAAETAFRAEQERKRALTRWGNMLPLAASYRAELKALIESPTLKILELKRDEIRRACPDGFRKLVQITNNAQEMTEILQERDRDAEILRHTKFLRAMAVYDALPYEQRRRRREDGLKPKEEKDPIYRRVMTPLGHLVGASFLTDNGDVRKFAMALRATLDAVDVIAQGDTNAVATTRLTALLSEMTERPQALSTALRQVSFTTSFFAPDNLDRIARWSSSEARFSYSRNEDRLAVRDNSSGYTIIEPLSHIDLPSCTAISMSAYIDENYLPMVS